MTAQPGPRPALDPTQTMVGSANGVGLWIAPPGTAAPELGDPFAAPWRPLGYASDDGVTQGGDTTSESITPWQSRSPIRTIITEKTRTVGFTLWQLNQDTLALYFDTEVPESTDGSYSFDVRTDGGGRIYAVGVDSRDGDNSIRFVYPRATLDSTGDMALTKGAMVPLEVTLSALDDSGVMVHIDVVAGGGAAQQLTVTATPADGAAADVAADAPSDTQAA